MNRIRIILAFLLIAGVACVHAQQPIVKINPGASECDVTAPPGAPIFQLDATGNVLVTGTLSGSCGGSPGNTPTFGLNPAPAGVVINGGSPVQAGTATTVPVTYRAYYASSCSMGTPTTTGTCPAITANAGCTGSGSPLSCSPASGALSVPTVASMGTNTSCTYTATANCGGVTSSANLTVTSTPVDQGGGIPAACNNLVPVGTGSGGTWSKVLTTTVKFGDGATSSGVNATDYISVWSYPGTTVAWPGSSGLTTRPTASVNQYFAEKFTAPSSTTGHPNWAYSGSGINSNMSITMGICPGDFGQAGTQLTTGCKVNMSASSSGLTATIAASQVGSYCTLAPGGTYYLNILPMASLPVSNISTSTCSGTCTPWLGVTN